MWYACSAFFPPIRIQNSRVLFWFFRVIFLFLCNSLSILIWIRNAGNFSFKCRIRALYVSKVGFYYVTSAYIKKRNSWLFIKYFYLTVATPTRRISSYIIKIFEEYLKKRWQFFSLYTGVGKILKVAADGGSFTMKYLNLRLVLSFVEMASWSVLIWRKERSYVDFVYD